MTAITKGGNIGLPAGIGRLRVEVGWSGGPTVDATALLLAGNGKVRSDADMVFYNQPASPEGAVRHLGAQSNRDVLGVDLAALPAAIETVAITASADGAPFSQVAGLTARVVDEVGGAELARFDVPSAATETAFVLGELYRRGGGWKFRAVGQGWASGLAGLARDYGISIDEPAAPAAPPAYQPPAPPAYQPPAHQSPAPPAYQPPAHQPPAPPAYQPQPGYSPASQSPQQQPPPRVNTSKGVRLQKQLQNQSPGMVNMVKKAGISLEKKGLGEHRARVALCLDISASMTSLYRSGKVQQLCERVLGLAVQFDDDGACDVFTFGTGGYEEGPLDLRNYHGWIQQLLGRRQLEGGTNYNRAMEAVRRHYFPDGGGGPRNAPRPDQLPVYVMFVTDGQTTDQNGTRNQVLWSSFEPLFWQFMALGQSTRNVTPDPSYDQTKHAFTQPGYPGQQPPPPPQPQRRRGFGARLAALATGDFKFLEELDDLPGRFLDNADFFSVADPAALPDGQLYDLMMNEYPGWVAQAKQRGLLPPG